MNTAVHVSEPVKDAVLTWANTGDLLAAAKSLEAARKDFATDLQLELRAEVADIVTSTLLEILANPAFKDDGEGIEIEGVKLGARQADCFRAWFQDQPLTAAALGLDASAWGKMLEAAILRRQSGSDAAGQLSPAEVSRLLGADRRSFEERPKPGSESAGLRGVLAARGFGEKKGS